MLKVTIYGVGYVGLVQAAIFASLGHSVMCVDIDSEKIHALQSAQVPIFEPGLAVLIKDGIAKGLLKFSTSHIDGVMHSNLQFITVGTPTVRGAGADLSAVLDVVRKIAIFMDADKLIVVKSTVPVGTASLVKEMVLSELQNRKVSHLAAVLSNPEFLREGSAVWDCQNPDRIIIGCDDLDSAYKLRDFYLLCNDSVNILVMDNLSAELTKYAANCMLATKISFINEIANLAEKFGADIESVRRGIASDPRIGAHFIAPGAGYGGSCFPKDIHALIYSAASVGFDAKLLKAVRDRNQEQKLKIYTMISQFYGNSLPGKAIALWGLAFKANTSDMREAPSLDVIQRLIAAGARVQAFDPAITTSDKCAVSDDCSFTLCQSIFASIEGADAIAIVTEWPEFCEQNFAAILPKIKDAVIFDGRNLFAPDSMAAIGFRYFSIGRPNQ